MSKTTTDASGAAGREEIGLSEPFERLAAALEALAKSEGAEAATAAGRAARLIAQGYVRAGRGAGCGGGPGGGHGAWRRAAPRGGDP